MQIVLEAPTFNSHLLWPSISTIRSRCRLRTWRLSNVGGSVETCQRKEQTLNYLFSFIDGRLFFLLVIMIMMFNKWLWFNFGLRFSALIRNGLSCGSEVDSFLYFVACLRTIEILLLNSERCRLGWG